jgi:hypothetical protein
MQTSLKAAELEPYKLAIRRSWRANESSRFWEVIQERWERVVEHSVAVIHEQSRGVALIQTSVVAAQEIIKLHRNVPFQDLAVTAMAVYFLSMERPLRFRDHQGLRFQLVRKVRALDDLAVYQRWNTKRQAMHRVYRNLPPRTVHAIADHLHIPFAEAAFRLYEHQKLSVALQADESRVMAEALKDLH